MDQNASNPINKPRYKPGLRLKKIELERVYKRLLNILHRDVEHLLVLSVEKALTQPQSAALVNYLKIMGDLKEYNRKNTENISTEELEKIINQK